MGVIIGTAGHIDHGKTELIKALTGIDTDRLKEEKERGMSIELGFAWIDLPKSGRVGIIDVPGHIKFIKNMLAGVGGVDVALLVVAADEGIMPQTREHFEIMRLLGVKKMLIVLTKKDLVDEEWLELAKDNVIEFLASYREKEMPIVAVSSKTREGLNLLIDELDKICCEIPPKPVSAISRLFIDRVFEMKGFGTVVTGTLASGEISEGDELFVYPDGLKVRARQIQVHHNVRKSAVAGERVAVNLVGVKAGKWKIERGSIISKSVDLKSTSRLAVVVDILPSVKVIKDRGRVRFYHGSSELLGRLSFIGTKEVKGSEVVSTTGRVFAKLLLEEPVTCFVGDRFVLYNYSPLWLIGGGKVLDIAPPQKLDLATLEAIDRGGIETAVLMKLASPQTEKSLCREIGLSRVCLQQILHKLEQSRQDGISALPQEDKIVRFGQYIISRNSFAALKDRIMSVMSEFYKKHPLRSYMQKSELRQRLDGLELDVIDELITRIDEIKSEKDKVQLKSYKPVWKEEELQKRNELADEFLKAGFQPPEPEMDEIFRSLLEDGTIVKVGESLFLHREVLELGKNKIAELIKTKGPATISELRDALSTTRKYVLPLMVYLDSIGFTIRVGDKRILAKDEG